MRVVLLHAFPLDERMWEPQLGALEAVGADVAAPRLYGPGDSLAAWAEPVVAGLGDRAVVVGASMGGYVAMAAARSAPRRLAGLVLVGARPGADDEERRRGRDATIERVRADGAEALWDDMAPKLLSGAAPEPAVEAARRMALARSPEELIGALGAMRDRPDSTEALSSLEVPVLVVVGEEDPFFPPAEAEALAGALPLGEAYVFPGAGHLPNLERPDAFNDRLAGFLERVD